MYYETIIFCKKLISTFIQAGGRVRNNGELNKNEFKNEVEF